MRVAAVQLEVALGDVAANLAACEELARAAAADRAEAIALPEFFTTGAAFLPSARRRGARARRRRDRDALARRP